MGGLFRSVRSVIERLGPDSRIVFHHVPKTGGTSVGSAIRGRFPLSSEGFDQNAAYRMVQLLHPDFDRSVLFSDEYLRFRREYFVHLLARGTRCIAGHFPFDETAHENYRDTYHFVTILRDPVKRFISHYFDSYDPVPSPDRPFAITESLSDLLETERGRRFGRIYSEFYSGAYGGADYTSSECIERAKANLDRFSVVGFLGENDRFTQQLAEECGVKIKIPHLRKGKTSSSQRRNVLTPELEDRVREACAVDIEIYEWARARFTGTDTAGSTGEAHDH